MGRAREDVRQFFADRMGVNKDDLPSGFTNGDLKRAAEVDTATMYGWIYLGPDLPKEAMGEAASVLRGVGDQCRTTIGTGAAEKPGCWRCHAWAEKSPGARGVNDNSEVTEHVNLFTYPNRTVTAGPDKCQSFPNQKQTYTWYECNGVLADDGSTPRMAVYTRHRRARHCTSLGCFP